MHITKVNDDGLCQLRLFEECVNFIPDLNPNEKFSRLIKKLIRDRHFALRFHSIQFYVTAPLFVYYGLKELFPNQLIMVPSKADEYRCWETCGKFTKAEDVILGNIFDQVRLLSTTLDNSNLLHILPMCTHVNFHMTLDILAIYELLSKLSNEKNYNSKMVEFSMDLFRVIHEIDPVLFNEELLKLYKTRS